MTAIHIKGFITPDHQLQLTLPQDAPVGAVEVTIHTLPMMADSGMTPDLSTHYPTGAEIVAMMQTENLWWDLDIEDSLSWLEEQRRKQWHRHL